MLVLDNAGWHVARALEVPVNLTLLFLPPYSPQLNPAEQLWAWLWSHRLFADYDDLLRETGRPWLALHAATVKSVCRSPWTERAVQA